MNSIDELQRVASALARSMAHDTTLSLAMAAAWLDPLRFSEASYQDDLYGNEEDPETLMRFALSVARDCSPRLYVEMTRGLRSGWSFQQFDDAFCASLKRLYPHIPLHSVYDMIYGIPLEFCGLEPTDPEFPSQFPRLAAVLDRFFGVRPTPRRERWQSEDHAEIAEQDLFAACQVVRPVIRSLIAEDRQPYADLALLLMYLFSITDNSLLDMSDEAYYESGLEPLQWERDQLAMADEACQQAHIVLDAVDRALAALETEEDIAQALIDNITIVRERRDTDVHLTWPDRDRPRRTPKSDQRAAGADASILLVRDCYAENDRDRDD